MSWDFRFLFPEADTYTITAALAGCIQGEQIEDTEVFEVSPPGVGYEAWQQIMRKEFAFHYGAFHSAMRTYDSALGFAYGPDSDYVGELRYIFAYTYGLTVIPCLMRGFDSGRIGNLNIDPAKAAAVIVGGRALTDPGTAAEQLLRNAEALYVEIWGATGELTVSRVPGVIWKLE